MKKLNFVSRFYYPDSPGGCEKVFYEIYRQAIKDYDVRIISSYKKKKKVFPKKSSVWKYYEIPKIMNYLYNGLNMSLRALKNNPDLIHANNIECVRLSKKPFVLSIHHVSHFMEKGIMNKLWRRMIKMQAGKADKVITVSEETKKDLKKIGVSDEKIIVIPDGINLNTFRKKKVKKNNKFTIIILSRISREKGQLFALNSYKKLPERIRKNTELKIAGYVSDEEYYDELKKNVSNDVEIITNIEKEERIVDMINKADLMIYPTFMKEGFGLVLLESMACGTPVLASEQDVLKETGGDACVYFKQGDGEELVYNIKKMYMNKELRERKIKKGLRRVKKYGWDKIYKKYKKVYEELL